MSNMVYGATHFYLSREKRKRDQPLGQQFWSYLIVHPDLTGSISEQSLGCHQPPDDSDNLEAPWTAAQGENVLLFSVYDVKSYLFFSKLNHTACRVILLPLSLVFGACFINHLILKVGKLKLWQAVCDQVKSGIHQIDCQWLGEPTTPTVLIFSPP